MTQPRLTCDKSKLLRLLVLWGCESVTHQRFGQLVCNIFGRTGMQFPELFYEESFILAYKMAKQEIETESTDVD